MEKVEIEGKFIRGPGKFLSDFNKIYHDNEEFRTGLMCCLIQEFVAKLSGNSNPQWYAGALNFCLEWSDTGNCKGHEFVARNLGIM